MRINYIPFNTTVDSLSTKPLESKTTHKPKALLSSWELDRKLVEIRGTTEEEEATGRRELG